MEISREIFKKLPQGEQNAISGKDAAKLLGFSDARAFQIAVNAERRTGSLILSNGHGYYRPENKEEVRRCYQTIRKRAVSTMAMLVEMRRWLDKNDTEVGENLHQMTIADFVGEEEPKENRTASVRRGIF